MLRPEERQNRMQEEEIRTSDHYPCKWCQGKTMVVKSFPPISYTRQHPIQWLRRRRRRCLECGRVFMTQEQFETPLEE